MKYYSNQGKEAPLYYWRDQHGHEVDLVIDEGIFLDLIEIKSGETFQKDFLKNIKWLNKLQGGEEAECIYGGNKFINLGNAKITPWNELHKIK
jgi:predicted AAA+ superfamily ATPase